MILENLKVYFSYVSIFQLLRKTYLGDLDEATAVVLLYIDVVSEKGKVFRMETK